MLAFLLASASGLAEPLGAAVALFVMNSTTYLEMENILSFVAGIMIAVAVLELIPEAKRHEARGYFASGIVAGIVVMTTTELLLPS